MKKILANVQSRQNQAIFNLTKLLNRDGIVKSDAYMRMSKYPNVVGLLLFLTKEKSCSGTAIPKATHNKIFYPQYIIISNKSQGLKIKKQGEHYGN